MTVERRSIERSQELLEQARGLIPMCSQTLSKSPSQWVQGVAPAFVERAAGAHVWDVDGNRYVDLPMALGPVVLGHAHPAVNAAVAAQLERGILYSLPHPLEIEAARRIVARVASADRVRFGKSGSDATTAAIRLARACTGRSGVLAGGYHGWHDWYIGSTSRHLGVPPETQALTGVFAFNDLGSLDAALERQGGGTAAVILEPAGATEPEPGFLEGVAERARAAGAVLIFDEIITGFRLAPGGAQERYGVHADLATYGKALGNGMPISALAGRAELMDRLEDVFFSGTHGGETLSLAAACATLDLLDEDACAALFSKGERVRAGVQAAIDANDLGDWVSIGGAAPRTVVQVKEPEGDASVLPAKTLVQQEMLKRGVLYNGNNFMCLAHSDDDLDQVVDAYEHALGRLAQALPDGVADALEGEPLQPGFRSVT